MGPTLTQRRGAGLFGGETKELGNQGARNVRGSAGARSSLELPFLAEHQYLGYLAMQLCAVGTSPHF